MATPSLSFQELFKNAPRKLKVYDPHKEELKYFSVSDKDPECVDRVQEAECIGSGTVADPYRLRNHQEVQGSNYLKTLFLFYTFYFHQDSLICYSGHWFRFYPIGLKLLEFYKSKQGEDKIRYIYNPILPFPMAPTD